MFFYCYNVQTFLPDTLYLYGRKIETENIKDLEDIENCKTTQLKITVDAIRSPILAVHNGKEDIQKLEEDVRTHFGNMVFIEEDRLKNIFYKDLDEEIDVIRFLPKNYKKIENFKSDSCAKIFHEFTNILEIAFISRKIKTPCVLQIKNNKTYINFTDIESVIKTNMPKLNFASFDFNFQNFDILSFSICIKGSKYYAGALKGHQNIDTKGKCNMEIFTNFFNMYNRIQQILEKEEIDGIIYFNSLGNLKNLFQRHIICDLFQYASANLKCREFSIKELCDYFSVPMDDPKNSLCVSKTLYDLFVKSNVLLLSKELSELSGHTINKVLNNNRAEIIEYALFHELYDKKYLLPPDVLFVSENYTGGLVLEPVKGCYENIVLLLDFNSLYPSIIQEFNVCFSNSEEKGILPKILANLVNRRKEVKKLMKENKDTNIFNIRQMALKILANSIYGSLGYPKSRFCNYKMASFITEKGREILQDTKKTIEEYLGLKVIYGDTDSIMIDTGLQYTNDNILKAKKISNKVIETINSKYSFIEIDLEKIFVRLFLYTKKKYMGKYLDLKNNIKEEYKGIDSVKRNICQAAIDILNKVNRILLDLDKTDLFKFLEDEFKSLPSRDVKDFIINNVLSKPPNQYPLNSPLPFVHLCNRLRDKGVVYLKGDVVSYIIGKSDKEKSFYKRAFLPNESFTLDLDYYIQNQILPPLIRTLSISRYFNIEKIYKIFKVNYKKTHIPLSCQIKTECCNILQYPSEKCTKCETLLTEEFYIKAVRELLSMEIGRLYSSPFECSECKIKYEGYFYKCIYCSNELSFIAKNTEFDSFLDDLVIRFTVLGFNKVVNYVTMHLDCSRFRVYDISPYFREEIGKHLN